MSECKDIPKISDHSCEPGGDCNAGSSDQTYDVVDKYGCVLSMISPRTDQQNTALFDCWAAESTSAAAIDVSYYILDRTLAPLIDDVGHQALYGEPNNVPRHRGPFTLRAVAKKPEKAPDSSNEGAYTDFRASLEIARTEFEKHGLKAPKVGDIVRFWDIHFYAIWGQPHHEEGIPGSGFYFDVINSEGDGYPFGGPMFTMFSIKIKRDTRYNPERKINGDTPASEDFDGF